jgi:hypothetical protein
MRKTDLLDYEPLEDVHGEPNEVRVESYRLNHCPHQQQWDVLQSAKD